MQAFTTLDAVAAPWLRDNVDTDLIIRVEPLFAGVPREALGPHALATVRFDAEGRERPEFVLNQPRYRGAGILLAGANFGCGSSREGAVWALLGLGIRCVVAPSFGDIFQGNCYQNGLLPVVLPADRVRALADFVAGPGGPRLRVDLEQCTVAPATDAAQEGLAPEPFHIPRRRREGLLRGLDELALTLADSARIDAWQARTRALRPWLLLEPSAAPPQPDGGATPPHSNSGDLP